MRSHTHTHGRRFTEVGAELLEWLEMCHCIGEGPNTLVALGRSAWVSVLVLTASQAVFVKDTWFLGPHPAQVGCLILWYKSCSRSRGSRMNGGRGGQCGWQLVCAFQSWLIHRVPAGKANATVFGCAQFLPSGFLMSWRRFLHHSASCFLSRPLLLRGLAKLFKVT